MAAASQTITWTGSGAAQSASSNQYYSTIVVENNTGVVLSVRTDGITAVVDATGAMNIEVGATAVFGNCQALPNASTKPNDSQGVYPSDISFTEGWNAQQGYTGTNLTTISMIPVSSISASATVTFQ